MTQTAPNKTRRNLLKGAAAAAVMPSSIFTAPAAHATGALALAPASATAASKAASIIPITSTEALRSTLAHFQTIKLELLADDIDAELAQYASGSPPLKDIISAATARHPNYLDYLETVFEQKPPANIVSSFVEQNEGTSLYQYLFGERSASEATRFFNEAIAKGHSGAHQMISEINARQTEFFKQICDYDDGHNKGEDTAQTTLPTFTNMASGRKAGGYPIPANYTQEQRSKIAIGRHVSGCEIMAL